MLRVKGGRYMFRFWHRNIHSTCLYYPVLWSEMFECWISGILMNMPPITPVSIWVQDEVGCGVAWALFWALFWVVLLFWALFWALKRVKPLKNVLSRVSMLFWALKKGLKRADLLKRVLNWEVLLKRGLNWVGHSKKCQREESRKKQEAVLRQEIKDVSISKHGWQGEQDYHRWTLANLKHWIFIKVQGSSKSNFIPNKRLVTLLNQYQKIKQKGFWTQSTLYSTNGAQMTFQTD